MKVVHDLSQTGYEKNTVVTVGTFDGVHRGHELIIRETVDRARRRGGRSVVVTFDPHPRKIIRRQGESVQLLSSLTERSEFCRDLHVDVFYVIEFTFEFSRQNFRDFYLRYVINGIGVSEVVEGYDHHFGRDREGNIETLVQLGGEFDFSVHAIQPVCVDHVPVSSSAIRTTLLEGNVALAARLLGRPYRLAGRVVPGDGRGKDLGYPTANLALEFAERLVPRNGIYFVEVIRGSERHFGMASIGVRPTFNTNGTRTIEVNILDFAADVYGELLELKFIERLRDELKYERVEDLVNQMRKDREESLRLRSMMSKS